MLWTPHSPAGAHTCCVRAKSVVCMHRWVTQPCLGLGQSGPCSRTIIGHSDCCVWEGLATSKSRKVTAYISPRAWVGRQALMSVQGEREVAGTVEDGGGQGSTPSLKRSVAPRVLAAGGPSFSGGTLCRPGEADTARSFCKTPGRQRSALCHVLSPQTVIPSLKNVLICRQTHMNVQELNDL